MVACTPRLKKMAPGTLSLTPPLPTLIVLICAFFMIKEVKLTHRCVLKVIRLLASGTQAKGKLITGRLFTLRCNTVFMIISLDLGPRMCALSVLQTEQQWYGRKTFNR